MPSILVIEHEGRYIERIQDALSSEGWKTRFVAGRPEALRAAASEQPDLVLVNSDLPGAAEMLQAFARLQGGPGAVALIPEHEAPPEPSAVGADEVLAKPFTDQQLRLVVRRGLNRQQETVGGAKAASSAASSTAAEPPNLAGPDEGPKLTSEDIFGDLLAEVEGQPEVAPATQPSTTATPKPAPGTGKPRVGAGADDPEIAKRLERTLSGLLDEPKAAKARPRDVAAVAGSGGEGPATPSRKRRSRRDSDDLDELLNLTLSSLEPPKKAPRKRSRPKASDELDLSEIEALGSSRPRKAPTAPAADEAPREAEGSLTAGTVEDPLGDVAEVFDAAWVEGSDSGVSQYRVQPPDDFEPRGLMAEKDAAPAAEEGEESDPGEPGGGEDGDRFGHYRLLDRIAIGGMAEVWKARMSGVEGFQKTVAIKKILPQMTDNADFIGMFIDEAKLAAQLNHPNITHIYDLGKIERDYYIAMEYVEGRNLRDVLNQARSKGMALPVALAVLIASRLASALDYAHRKRDFDDRELELVHRDVSPQNVLISYEGDIKLCDFGIVKAVTKATHTQMGALKGKLQYMSPEQAWGRTVDARSDIFSLGALLFEMLTGERLFAGDNEISVLEAVRECHLRSPEEINPGLPEGLETVAFRALEKEPEDRYESAGDMHSELEAILYRLQPTPNQADLGAWLRQLEDGEPMDDEARQRFAWSSGAALGPTGVEGVATDADVGSGNGALAPAGALGAFEDRTPDGVLDDTDDTGVTHDGDGTDDRLDDTDDTTAGVAALAPPEGSEVVAEEGGRRNLWLLIAGIALLLVLGAVWYFTAGGGSTPGEGEAAPEAVTLPAEAAGTPAVVAGPEGAAEATGATDPQTADPPAADAQTLDLEAMLDEQMEAKEKEIESAVRDSREPELRRLREELRRLRAREEAARAETAAAAAAREGADGETSGAGGDSDPPANASDDG